MTFPPKIVRARGVVWDGRINLLLSEETWNNALATGDAEKVGQYAGLVQTGLPGLETESGLLLAHSLWQGLRRPAGAEVSAPNHYAYILRPAETYTYDRSLGFVPGPAPRSAVFMVVVELPPSDDPRIAEWTREAGVEITGQIQDWDWFLADLRPELRDQPSYPENRFHHRHW